jgi:DNA-binding response OmpR family regulator
MHILLLEDDPILLDLINDNLKESGHNVSLAINGKEALEKIENEKFDLFIFDISVPYISGIEILKTIREYNNNTPTILITAYQDITHLKDGFELGCDDYLKKPFDFEELDQRIKNIQKRFNIETSQEVILTPSISFNTQKKELNKDGQIVHLSQKECEILNYFNNNRQRTITNDELMQNIWSYDELPTDATIRVYIKNLRNLISKDAIKTIRGIGYYFDIN